MWELIERWRRINSKQSGNVPHGALYYGGPEVGLGEVPQARQPRRDKPIVYGLDRAIARPASRGEAAASGAGAARRARFPCEFPRFQGFGESTTSKRIAALPRELHGGRVDESHVRGIERGSAAPVGRGGATWAVRERGSACA